MAWTERSTDLLVTGLVGILGALIGGLFSGLGSRVWLWWDRRQKLKKDLMKYTYLLTHTDSPSYISNQLKSFQLFLLENEEVLRRPSVRSFFDEWLQEDLSGESGHSRFACYGVQSNILSLRGSLVKLHW